MRKNSPFKMTQDQFFTEYHLNIIALFNLVLMDDTKMTWLETSIKKEC